MYQILYCYEAIYGHAKTACQAPELNAVISNITETVGENRKKAIVLLDLVYIVGKSIGNQQISQ